MGEPTDRAHDEPGSGPVNDQPGLDAIRNAVHNRIWRPLPKGASLRRDAIAGLSSAISNVPDGMANGALFGVSPIHGPYGTMAGPAVGGVLLRLERLLRFVSYSVTAGFLSGISVLLVLNQLPVITGRDAPGGLGGAIRLLFEFDTVRLVRDSGDIPQGLPLPRLPTLAAFTLDIVAGAAAVAIIILPTSWL